VGLRSVQVASSISSAVVEVTSFDLDPAILTRLDLLQARDETTFRHSQAVAELMAAFARHLMMEPDSIRLLGLAGLLHDIGKTELSIAVLDKPGRLTANEVAHVRSHPARGTVSCPSLAVCPTSFSTSACTTMNAWTARAIQTAWPLPRSACPSASPPSATSTTRWSRPDNTDQHGLQKTQRTGCCRRTGSLTPTCCASSSTS
jgi:putative nucleotidyltransferase with HDIG domain